MIEKSIKLGLKEFAGYKNEPATWIRIKQLYPSDQPHIASGFLNA
jgi:hypothetical protein